MLARMLALSLLFVAHLNFAQTINPVSTRKIDPLPRTVAWIDSKRLLVAGTSGVRLLSLPDGAWSEMISTVPIPDGLPDPLTVTTDGKSVVASNGFERTQFACR